jgi:hypothetical protein
MYVALRHPCARFFQEQEFAKLAGQYIQVHTVVSDASGLRAPAVRALARDTATAATMCGAVAACFSINFAVFEL